MTSIRTRVSLLVRTIVAAVCGLVLSSAVVGAALLLVAVPVYAGVRYGAATLSSPEFFPGIDAGLVGDPLAAALVVAVAIPCLAAIELSLRTVRTARERSAPAGALAQGAVELASYVLLFSSLLLALAALPYLRSALPEAAFALLVLLGFFYLLTVGYAWAAYEWLRSRDDVDDERTTGGNWLVFGVFVVGYLSVAYWAGFALLVVAALIWLVVGSTLAPGHVDRIRDAIERRAAESAEEEPVDPDDVYGVTDEVRRLRGRLERAVGLHPAVPTAVGVLVAAGTGYWAGALASVETVAGSLAVVSAVAFVGVHVGGAIRAEFAGDAAVLRDLEDRFDLETLASDESATWVVDGAVEPDPTQASLRSTATRLARQADLPAPDIRVLEHETPVALTVGYRPAASTLVCSRGLIEALSDRELEAVIAHELAHVKNRDAAVLTALSASGAVANLARSRYGYNPVVEPLAVAVRLASRWYVALVSRGREYAADDGAVAITGDSAALASALETLDDDLESRPSTDLREGDTAAAFAIVPPPWEEHRFFDRTRRFVARGIFGTHPATVSRLERLRSAASGTDR
ncbi:M48 family metallopeptidase [Natrialbaceae archaeon AArc-T1-2]|uniref:M48 family metallopeptidase n=1 Tax=Natrialbaceae archaeon AArc-T1-2 TaxID=3053904 RepID=UPI00255A94BE|nr:M48 family metallopeptidase [Natrialbaceae archaeon AArc-T1-2]WIV66144.1 M48 family metallopeptidase [Natrialbaceae archaeon AArc-T1-2]